MIRFIFILCLVLLSSPAWAFPSTSVLDSFTGADGTTPPSASWTNAIFTGASSGNVVIQDNAVTGSGANTDAEAYWNVSSFGADCEAFATFVDVSVVSKYGALYCRLANIGASTTDGYALEANIQTGSITINRVDNGAFTALGAAVAQAITTTDKMGLKTVGDQICLWFSDSGGAWTELACRTDATYSAGGRIGIGVNGSTATGILDDFGGGTVVTSTRRAVAPIHLQ